MIVHQVNSEVSVLSFCFQMPDNEVFSPCSIDHHDVFMYDDEKSSIKCERSDSPTYLDISSNKSATSFPHIKSGTTT